MATKQLWINLPVKNIEKSKSFFIKIGFELNKEHGQSPVSTCFLVGEKSTAVMLFEESVFEGFSHSKASNTTLGSEMLISFDAERKAEIDNLVAKVKMAGGTVFGEPSDIQGWMYGCGFSDLDGHRWNALFMDYSKMK
jgi:uncharacterized protein